MYTGIIKKKTADPIITKRVLEGILDERFDKQTKLLLNTFQEYRDEVLTRMDKDAGELEQIREDQVFINRDLKDPEERIAKLEHPSKTA